MALDPGALSTVSLDQLPATDFNLTDIIPHGVGADMKGGTVQELADFLSSYLGVISGIGFRAVTVPDGGTLPTTTQEEYILVGAGTYTNVGGGSPITTTEELNALISNGTYWSIGVEIPIDVELAGITQLIRTGFTNTTPSEDAIFNALALKANAADINEVNAFGWFMYNDLTTQTTPIPFVTNVDKKLTNDGAAPGSTGVYAPFGITNIWNTTTNQMDFSQLAIGDVVNMRLLVETTTTVVNQTYNVGFKSAIGSPSANTVIFLVDSAKTAGTKRQAVSIQVAVSNFNNQTFPSEFFINSDGGGNIKVLGFFFSIIRKNVNIATILNDPSKEDITNKTNAAAIVGSEADTTKYASLAGFTGWIRDTFTSWIATKTTPVDLDLIVISDSADSFKTKKVTFSNARTFFGSAYIVTNVQTGTTYTLVNSDNGKQLIFTNAAAVTVTVPTGLTNGFNCELYQQGTGKVTVVASGTTLRVSTYEVAATSEQYSLIAIDNVPNVTETYHIYGQTQSI